MEGARPRGKPKKTWRDTHTTVLLLFWSMPGTTRVSRYQKGKTRKAITNLDLLEQEIVSGSGICWAICKSAHHPKQPRQHPTTQFFTGRMPFLPPNQQHQCTEGKKTWREIVEKDCQARKLNREDAVDRNRWRCEWVKVSSRTGSPGLSQTKSRQPLKGVCVCVCGQN